MEDMETKERKSLWGDRPNGYIVLTPGGRWIVVQTAEGRKARRVRKTERPRFGRCLPIRANITPRETRSSSMSILRGTSLWTGTQQVRYYKIEGDELHIEAPPQPFGNFGDKVMRGILTYSARSSGLGRLGDVGFRRDFLKALGGAISEYTPQSNCRIYKVFDRRRGNCRNGTEQPLDGGSQVPNGGAPFFGRALKLAPHSIVCAIEAGDGKR